MTNKSCRRLIHLRWHEMYVLTLLCYKNDLNYLTFLYSLSFGSSVRFLSCLSV